MVDIEDKNMRVFPVVDDEEFRYNELKERSFKYTNLPPENKRVIPGVGNVVSDEEMFKIRQLIKDEAIKHGFPEKLLNLDYSKSELDKKIGEILYTEMNITPSVAATLPMWYFFSIYLIPDIVYWRWGDSVSHYISKRRNYCGTQWWRYYLFSKDKNVMKIFKKMEDGEIADLYERTGTAGLPDHITDIAIWFDELDETNVEFNSRELRRETIKLYNAELGFRLFFTLSEDDKFELFKVAFEKAKVNLTKKK